MSRRVGTLAQHMKPSLAISASLVRAQVWVLVSYSKSNPAPCKGTWEGSREALTLLTKESPLFAVIIVNGAMQVFGWSVSTDLFSGNFPNFPMDYPWGLTGLFSTLDPRTCIWVKDSNKTSTVIVHLPPHLSRPELLAAGWVTHGKSHSKNNTSFEEIRAKTWKIAWFWIILST